jgi:hypothetical protein
VTTTHREESDNMSRVILQRTDHLRRSRCAPCRRKSVPTDTVASPQTPLGPLAHTAVPRALLATARWPLSLAPTGH